MCELAALGVENVVLLSPSGLGVPLPEVFDANLDGYRDWLIGELT
nr:hypothetical protein [Actinoplanes polyasparticus]